MMQLTHSFIGLLNAVLVVLTISEGVRAVPTYVHGAVLEARQPLNASEARGVYESIDARFLNLTARDPEPRVINVPLQAYQLLGQDVGYLMGIKLGTQPQITPMLVDSGSSTFWAVSETSPQKGSRRGYGPKSSSTYEDLQKTWEIRYGDGSTATGPVARDSVTASRLDAMPGFPIGVGETLTGQLATGPFGGIAGFSNGKIGGPTRTGGVTLMEGLTDSKLVPKNVVGITLGRGANGAAGSGQITLGGSNTDKYQTGAGNLVKVRNRGTTGLWQLSLANSKVGGKTVRTTRNAILDTGNARMLTTKGDGQFFHNYPGAWTSEDGIFGVPCDHTKIPQISITVGSVEFDINSVDIVGPKIEAPGVDNLCYSNIQDSDRTSWSIGIPFMKSFYQILDVDNNEITMAKLK